MPKAIFSGSSGFLTVTNAEFCSSRNYLACFETANLIYLSFSLILVPSAEILKVTLFWQFSMRPAGDAAPQSISPPACRQRKSRWEGRLYLKNQNFHRFISRISFFVFLYDRTDSVMEMRSSFLTDERSRLYLKCFSITWLPNMP